jgi:hypothetical protein
MICDCEWRLNVRDGYYDTSCGEIYWFRNVTLKTSGFKFCPFCGGKIEEK